MANKMFYIKELFDNKEFCLVIGYVKEGHAYCFIRNKDTHKELKSFGTLQIDKAFELMSRQKGVVKYE